MEVLTDLVGFMKARKNFKIIPIVAVLLILTVLKRLVFLKFI
jgi:hypothetical protein